MISGSSEREYRKATSNAVTQNELKEINDQPKSRNFGFFHFNQQVCYWFCINFIKFFVINIHHEEVI